MKPAQEKIEKIDQHLRIQPLWIIGGDFYMITRLEEKRGGWVKLDC